MTPEQIKETIKKFCGSARNFHNATGIPYTTITSWMQGKRQPDKAALTLLKNMSVCDECKARLFGTPEDY